MATSRRKPATRSRRAPAKKSGGRSGFTYLVFGLILGLALAAFLSFYLKSTPLPFSTETSQNSRDADARAPQQVTQQAPQQTPLQAPTRTSEAQVLNQTTPKPVAAQQDPESSTSTPIAAQQAPAQTATPNQTTPPSSDPIGAIIDPNSGLVTAPVAQSNHRIQADALIKQKPETSKAPNTATQNNTVPSKATAPTTTANKAVGSTTTSKSGSPDQIAQLIQAIPAEKKAPTVSQNIAKAPLRIEAPSSVAATDKGVHLSNTTSNNTKNTASTNKAPTSSTPRYLQVGSFANYQEADATRARMLLLGFNNVSISKTRVNNTEFNRVRIGPFNDEQTLKNSQQKLQSANIKSTVVR